MPLKAMIMMSKVCILAGALCCFQTERDIVPTLVT